MPTEQEPKQTPPLLNRLPIPPLQDTLNRYIDCIEPLQDLKQNKRTRDVVFSPDNLENLQILHDKLVEYDTDLAKENPFSSYIEQFWYDSYLLYDASVVLSVNPFFQLQDDPTLKDTNSRPIMSQNGPYGAYTVQIKRTSKLVTSMLKFIHQIRSNTLKPDTARGGVPLSMDQYNKLFGSARIPPGPGENSCHLQTDNSAHHVMVMYKQQFYWFDVLDIHNNPLFKTPDELEWNLYSIIMDGNASQNESKLPFGVFTTESRRIWSNVRDYIYQLKDRTNWKNLKLIDSALFVICLDDVAFDDSPEEQTDLTTSMLCGTSKVNLDFKSTAAPLNIQSGTCLNRWYDKLQLIVTMNGKAGMNFEHTGVDGHTVLRLATDIYTDSILSFARGVTTNVLDIFKDNNPPLNVAVENNKSSHNVITIPRKLEWQVDPFLLSSLHFAETKISDLISQYELVTLDFTTYGASQIKKKYKCSPDAFTQQIFQIAYYALYGKFETVYEPAMTKLFQNGRTEAIRSVTLPSKKFVKSIFDRHATDEERKQYLQESCKEHSRLTKECSSGLGQDRHLYALYSIWNEMFRDSMPLPGLFQDKAWSVLSTSIISTSNCGNPCLKSFGFGPVTPNGFGIGYIIRDESITVVVSSKHRQTQRFVSLIEKSFLEIDHIFNREANSLDPISLEKDKAYLMRSRRMSDTLEKTNKSEDLRYLFSGYDYFDVSVTG
ncbi:putative mitochondrial carnitine O-acetyltransferase [Monosporozyma servazzii]